MYQGRTQYRHVFNCPVFQCRSQYGAGIDDVLRNIWRFFRQVAIKGDQTRLKASNKAIKDDATAKKVFRSTLKKKLNVVFGATAEQVANRFTSEKQTAVL